MTIAEMGRGQPSRLAFQKYDRLNKALDISGVSSQEMAAHLEVSRTTISNYINGRTEPSKSQVRDWALKTGVPLEWIEFGIDPDDSTPEKITVRLRPQGGVTSLDDYRSARSDTTAA